MLKKRLIGVITVLNGWAVQSFGYKNYLPLGRPEVLAKNLDNWGADEIIIQSIDRSINRLGPDLNLIKSIGNLSLSTPLTYGGGVSNPSDSVNVIKNGCERIIIDSLLLEKNNNLEEIVSKIGTQSIIGSIPTCLINNKIFWFDYKNKSLIKDFKKLDELISKNLLSEIFLIDKEKEGYQNSFRRKIYELFPISNIPLILFGGLNDKNEMIYYLNKDNVSSIAVGNSLNYGENVIQYYKKNLINHNIRAPYFKSF